MEVSNTLANELPNFDEEAYLSRNPDIASAIREGKLSSGREHFIKYGRAEGRVAVARCGANTKVSLGPVGECNAAAATTPSHAIDAVLLTEDGWLLIIGWTDDETNRLQSVRLDGRDWSFELSASAFMRVARADVQEALKHPISQSPGFLGLVSAGYPLPATGECRVVLEWTGKQQTTLTAPVQQLLIPELRETVLGCIARAKVGGSHIPAMLGLTDEFVDQVLALNRAVTAWYTAQPFVESFGPTKQAFKGSIIVCLYGRPEYMFLQGALFSGKPGFEDYEFVYICNSPELLECLLNQARCNALIYGLSQTVVGLPGNAGFGAANNVGVAQCRSDRILCVNPDVFPYESDWAARHTEIIERGEAGSRLFGAALYYDDGSLMHGGMHVKLDTGVAIRQARVESRLFARVEHYGKGAPPDTSALVATRPVAAVSGAFISVERAWFETLGGFSQDYVLGHYEDADLCLRSLQAGVPAWLQDLRLWHLEGRGSHRLATHEGAIIINRYLFSRTWSERISAGLCDKLDSLGQPQRLA